MAGAAVEVGRVWAEQLANLSDHVLQQVPDSEDWEVLRHFLSNMSGVLRRADIRAGTRLVMRILPYVQRGVSSVEKYNTLTNSCEITDTISKHFLVDDQARQHIENFMKDIHVKMDLLKDKVEGFAKKLDEVLEACFVGGESLGVFLPLKLAFQMNRVSALIQTCEDRLVRARAMIDQLDTHVAGKSLLATMASFLCFIFGIALSAAGQVPAGAACLTAASASRQSAQNLDDYRRRLQEIDHEHRQLQAELQEWKARFRAEQRNLLLLWGIRRVVACLATIALVIYCAGRAVNYVLFSAVTLYLVARSEQTNAVRFYAAMGVALLSLCVEYTEQTGLRAFNTASVSALTAAYMGYIDL